ncbi:hypothetical protein LJC24_01245 [Desulfococcaceae bacterium OttesenSCG-928-F15]|nr:hypothetical protein [Desulfococcaceae bacterium OttesenSCG-928-F15]
MVKPGTYFFTNPLPMSEAGVNGLFIAFFFISFLISYAFFYFRLPQFESTALLIGFMCLLFLGPIFCFIILLELIVWLKAWRWPARMRENLVSSIEVNAREFRILKINGALLPFGFTDCTPSILAFRERKRIYYCLKVAYLEHGPDYFLLGNVWEEAENLRLALRLPSFVEEAPIPNTFGSWSALPKRFDWSGEASHVQKEILPESSVPEKTKRKRSLAETFRKWPELEGETLILSLPWDEDEVSGLNLPIKLLVTGSLALVIAILVAEIFSGASFILYGAFILALLCGISWIWGKRAKVCALHASMSGLHLAYDDDHLVLYPHTSCFFQKYWHTHGEYVSLFLRVRSIEGGEIVFEKLFDGMEKELDELLHALVRGAERSRQER